MQYIITTILNVAPVILIQHNSDSEKSVQSSVVVVVLIHVVKNQLNLAINRKKNKSGQTI